MPHQVEASVAEGGDGVEDTVPSAAKQAIIRDKPDGKETRPNAFHR